MSAIHTFEHPAMGTTFTVRLSGVDAHRAAEVASVGFRELDRLEQQLSRYRRGSDVSRINALSAGQILYVSERCHQCLQLAMEAQTLTGGRFSVTRGASEAAKRDRTRAPRMLGGISVEPTRPMVRCLAPGYVIDLGGFVKGFALDALSELLRETGTFEGLLSAGDSTHLALGHEDWPVQFCEADGVREVFLRGTAFSVSGRGVQGNHVIPPFDEDFSPVFDRVGVRFPKAAIADALSTACFLMTPEELAAFRRSVPDLQEVLTVFRRKLPGRIGEV